MIKNHFHPYTWSNPVNSSSTIFNDNCSLVFLLSSPFARSALTRSPKVVLNTFWTVWKKMLRIIHQTNKNRPMMNWLLTFFINFLLFGATGSFRSCPNRFSGSFSGPVLFKLDWSSFGTFGAGSSTASEMGELGALKSGSTLDTSSSSTCLKSSSPGTALSVSCKNPEKIYLNLPLVSNLSCYQVILNYLWILVFVR